MKTLESSYKNQIGNYCIIEMENSKVNGIKLNKCKLCGKKFAQARSLNKHIHTVHEGLQDHKCEPCGKSFSQPRNLKRHIHTVHEGHKDYKCKSCGKSFSRVQGLKKHIQIIQQRLQM